MKQATHEVKKQQHFYIHVYVKNVHSLNNVWYRHTMDKIHFRVNTCVK